MKLFLFVFLCVFFALLHVVVAHSNGADITAVDAPPAKEATLMMAGLFPPKTVNLIDPYTIEQTKKWVKFSQCDAAWGNNELGTGSLTICQAGCAMTSLTMALASHGVRMNPGTMNSWLKSHGGYADADELVWSASNALGSIQFNNYYHGSGSLSSSGLADAVAAGKSVIVNVRSGTHWVLVTGHAGGNTFTVNDPGFATTSYDWSGMSNFVVYTK